MGRLSTYAYGGNFEPIIKNRDPRTIGEFVELTGGVITQTAAISAVRECIGRDDIIITAGGSLPSCLQRMWTTDKRGGYHAEYGYSCMGYEVAAALGVKMAEPDNEVYAFVGDASFQMLHSEIMTAMQERVKINILVFDNCGFGCINNLQMNHGVDSLATEFRYRNEHGEIKGGLIPVDYAQVGRGYGLETYTVRTIDELKAALLDTKKQAVSTLIDLKVLPKTMTDGYNSFWNVGVAASSAKPEVMAAYKRVLEGRNKARQY
jgi:3D-(3,5/4)-trihydroxycyclohexane-1,2-dione acylhydrolase (decyclizing)